MYFKISEWFSLHKKEALLGAIVFLAASISFALGYLANREFNHAAIVIEKCSDALK